MTRKPDREMLARGRIEAMKAIYEADARWVAKKALAMRDALEPVAGNSEILCDVIAGLDEISALHSDKNLADIAAFVIFEEPDNAPNQA